MRTLTLSLLTAGLVFALPAIAQDPWANTDPNCAPEFHQGAVEAAQAAQDKSLADAQATDEFNKRIKDSPADDFDKLLSCVDEAWPNLPFTGTGSGVEEFIKTIAEENVDQACRHKRDELRDARSVFVDENFAADNLRSIGSQIRDGNQPNPGGGQQQPGPGAQPNPGLGGVQPNPGGGQNQPNPGNQQPNPGTGIGDLLRPSPQPPPGGGAGDGIQ